MQCPNCNFNSINKICCDNCGENPYLLTKSINNSIKLYNNALVKTNLREYSEAIILCKKSIYFDKSNTEARNLLGLLYYKIGRVAEALKQWILSTNFDEDDQSNTAFNYIAIFQEKLRDHEVLNDSVIIYNEAINYLKTRNDDLAVIRLKKALDINPMFIDAINLLSFCYILQKKYKNASLLLEVALNIDPSNQVAKQYVLEIENNTNKKGNIEKPLIDGYSSNGNLSVLDDDVLKNKDKSSTNSFFAFIGGGLLMSLFMYYLIIPELNQQRINALENLNSTMQLDQSATSEALVDREARLEALQVDLLDANNKISYYANRDILIQARNLFENGQLEDAIIVFWRVDISNFDEATLNTYSELKLELGL
ncbi:MAG: hypothetical protein R3Y29_04495 [bacterium]